MIDFRSSPLVTNDALNTLFAAGWPDSGSSAIDFEARLAHSLAWVCAFDGDALVGFVNVAWDGGIHAFILDTTVHPDYRRLGIGRRLVAIAADAARAQGIHWLHVDFEPHLKGFYAACGFTPTDAGLMRLQ